MFITLEGIEGSGKTTHMDHMAAFLESRGYRCVKTREPGGTAIGKQIRAILLDPANSALEPRTELLLYTADRAQHFHQVVEPALAEGRIVLCDRCFDATVVYQGYARGLDKNLIYQLHRLVLGGRLPDITLLLDLEPETGLQRAWNQIHDGSRRMQETRFENEALAFHQRVRAGYLDLAHREPERFCIIDAARDESDVREAIIRALAERITAFPV